MRHGLFKISLASDNTLGETCQYKAVLKSAIKTADLGSFIHTFFRGYKLPQGGSFVAT